MSSACPRAGRAARALAVILMALGTGFAAHASPNVLRVCADPNNLPFSNAREEGFENRIVRLIAAELGAAVDYTWWAQRRGFIRNTLNAGRCDVVPGVPAGDELTLATRPYYRSSYVGVLPTGSGKEPLDLDDPALRELRIGVQMIGDDFANPPPAHALGRRGMVDNVRGFLVYGDYGEPSPGARIVEAVAAGEVDLALVWGPIAGYFAAREEPPLALAPIAPAALDEGLPFTFAIAMGVRKGAHALRDRLDRLLVRLQPEIDRILAEFDIPTVEAPEGPRRRSYSAAWC